MGLFSVTQTALSGLQAAQTSVAVIGNNLANANTVGFKASRPEFVDHSSQTVDSGAGPSASNAGQNPIQIGRGVRIGSIGSDFSQGVIALNTGPLDLAVSGEGFFQVEGSSGERFYTRNGQFSLDGSNRITTANGSLLLGNAVDENFELLPGELVPLRISESTQIEGSDGTAASLIGFGIGEDGGIRGHFSDGSMRNLGRVQLARFANPDGLRRMGDNLFAAGVNSGSPIQGTPTQDPMGYLIPGGLELSNTNIGQELINLNLASNSFRMNMEVLGTADAMLDELLYITRR